MTAVRSLVSPAAHFRAARQLSGLLSRHRHLTWELTRQEIRERYAGQVFGTLWAIGHPLLMMALYVVVFAYVFRIRMGGGALGGMDYTAYLLSGLVPWLTFQEIMNKSSMAIVQNAGLVKQVVFPVEVLPVKGVLASMLNLALSLAVLLTYQAVRFGSVPWTWTLVPALMLFQVLAMIGVAYLLSAVGTFFRDLKDIVMVLATAGFYLIPALYVPGSMPPAFLTLMQLNPFAHMVWCYQDILYFGRFEHPLSWVVFPALSLLSFYAGFRVFRKLRPMFGNVL